MTRYLRRKAVLTVSSVALVAISLSVSLNGLDELKDLHPYQIFTMVFIFVGSIVALSSFMINRDNQINTVSQQVRRDYETYLLKFIDASNIRLSKKFDFKTDRLHEADEVMIELITTEGAFASLEEIVNLTTHDIAVKKSDFRNWFTQISDNRNAGNKDNEKWCVEQFHTNLPTAFEVIKDIKPILQYNGEIHFYDILITYFEELLTDELLTDNDREFLIRRYLNKSMLSLILAVASPYKICYFEHGYSHPILELISHKHDGIIMKLKASESYWKIVVQRLQEEKFWNQQREQWLKRHL